MTGRYSSKMGTISDAIAQYDDEHSFARLVTLPEEDRPNVVCLEKARRIGQLMEKAEF